MTISTTTIKDSYAGNGSTSAFTYNFKIADDDDIQVIIRAANGTETVKTKTIEDRYYCSTARHYDHMCGVEGKFYEPK